MNTYHTKMHKLHNFNQRKVTYLFSFCANALVVEPADKLWLPEAAIFDTSGFSSSQFSQREKYLVLLWHSSSSSVPAISLVQLYARLIIFCLSRKSFDMSSGCDHYIRRCSLLVSNHLPLRIKLKSSMFTLFFPAIYQSILHWLVSYSVRPNYTSPS